MDNTKSFFEYLANGSQAVTPTTSVVQMVGHADPILNTLAGLKAVEMVAKDLHYRAKGKSFFAVHELADMIWEVRHHIDELIEVYYLGEKLSIPPLMEDICSKALGMVNCIDCASSSALQEDALLNSLQVRCEVVLKLVEDAKKLALRSGTQAVLDDISKKMLKSIGLLNRTTTPPAIEGDCVEAPTEVDLVTISAV